MSTQPAEHVLIAPTITRQGTVMQALYGQDIWHGYVPSHPRLESIQGWNGRHPAFERLLGETSNKTFIDVGVWKGQSTVFVANMMRRTGVDGCVISIDTFLGSSEHWRGAGQLFERRLGRPDLYETFLENVFYNEVANLVIPFAQTSTTAARILRSCGIRAGIVHIDASHDYEDVLRDAECYWQIVEPGGYLIGDDYGKGWAGVTRAADEFSAKVGEELVIQGPKWIVRKMR